MTGAGDIDGHGDRHRFYPTLGSYGGYVDDWYVNTGSPSTWKPKTTQC